MKCPLFTVGWSPIQMGVAIECGECLKEECAWWHIGGSCCSVLSIAATLNEVEQDIDKGVKDDSRQ